MSGGKRSKAAQFRIWLNTVEVEQIMKPVRGEGGMQSVLRRLQAQLRENPNGVVAFDIGAGDFERIFACVIGYGSGGFQARIRRAFLRPIVKAASS
jgi:hypothetical protein